MHIEMISSRQQLVALRASWDALYERDPEAQLFLSWTWIQRWVQGKNCHWCVLVARPSAGAAPVALFPLRRRVRTKASGEPDRQILMAGNCGADYTGFICDPEYQDRAIPAFARYLRQLTWDSLHLENLCASSKRTDLFLSRFPARDFETSEVGATNPLNNIDNLICPHVRLPADWESYLQSLSANTRQKIRRFLRKVDAAEDYRITHATAETIERDLDVLAHFWTEKWGETKGPTAEPIRANMRVMLGHCFQEDSLLLPVLWRGSEALGALGILVDRRKKDLMFLIGGCDTTLNNPPPGVVLHAHSIRHGIANGFSTYDFLRGNEPYKYMFGSEERRIRCLILQAKPERQLRLEGARPAAPKPMWASPPASLPAFSPRVSPVARPLIFGSK